MTMWSPEDFPGAKNVPWQLLIRARYVYEIDAVLASIVVNRLSAFATEAATEKVASVLREAVGRASSEPANGEHRLAAMEALADWENDWCGTGRWPHWPGPHPHFDDPITSVVIAQAGRLFDGGASEGVQSAFAGFFAA